MKYKLKLKESTYYKNIDLFSTYKVLNEINQELDEISMYNGLLLNETLFDPNKPTEKNFLWDY